VRIAGSPAAVPAEPVVAVAAVPAQPQPQTQTQTQRARALYDFAGQDRGELPFRKGDVIEEVEQTHPDWWRGRVNGSALGLFPANYVVCVRCFVCHTRAPP
jgi:hypothetical protein